MHNRAFLVALVLVATLAAACASRQPLPRENALAVGPVPIGQQERREVTNVFVVTDASGTMYINRTFPRAKALSETFVKALPDGRARAVTQEYNVATIGFGGDDRVESALTPFDRQRALDTVGRVEIMGEIGGRGGRTPLDAVIGEIGEQLEGRRGATAVVLFTDGLPDDSGDALEAARILAEEYGGEICYHGVHVGEDPEGLAFLRELASVTPCGSSRRASEVASGQSFERFAKAVLVGPAPLPPVAAAPPNRCATVRLRGIEFAFDKSNVDEAGAAVLDAAAERLSECGKLPVRVEGHTDSIGTESYNQGLSERRAKAVEDYLAGRGISTNRMSAEGFGESMPVASNETREGRARNRRVELKPIE